MGRPAPHFAREWPWVWTHLKDRQPVNKAGESPAFMKERGQNSSLRRP
jgi:hypothetical protein